MNESYKPSPFIIDVREPDEFARGAVVGAINIPLALLLAQGLESYELPIRHPILVYCRSGGRAAMACQALNAAGFTHVQNGLNQITVEELLG